MKNGQTDPLKVLSRLVKMLLFALGFLACLLGIAFPSYIVSVVMAAMAMLILLVAISFWMDQKRISLMSASLFFAGLMSLLLAFLVFLLQNGGNILQGSPIRSFVGVMITILGLVFISLAIAMLAVNKMNTPETQRPKMPVGSIIAFMMMGGFGLIFGIYTFVAAQ